MKTELEIAKENFSLISPRSQLIVCRRHKATCERWLEFLEEQEIVKVVHSADIGTCHDSCEFIDNKIKDLKQTIALYEENGI